MEVTQEGILTLLIEQGGKVKNSDLLGKFKDTLNCADPAEKKQNRDLFKRFVNNVAVVKEIDDVKYVVIRKKYQHVLKGPNDDNNVNRANEEEVPSEHSPVRDKVQESEHNTLPHEERGSGNSSHDQEAASTSISEGASDHDSLVHSPTEGHFLVESALQRTKWGEFKLKRALNFNIDQTPGAEKEESVCAKTEAVTHNKPYALPLRTPPSATTRIEIRKLKTDDDVDDPPATDQDGGGSSPPSGNQRRQWEESGFVESPGFGSPPQPRRGAAKTASEEPPRFPSAVPLEQAEHEWLVRSASGHWSQVYGLLLRDAQLADRRDFVSGFTALHWAAKSGNSEMVAKIVGVTKERGVEIDVNARTHGGYTPLHIAALHDQEFVLAMLVDEYGADVNVRDNCGKKPYHYLHKGISDRVRELLGEPKTQPQREEAVGQERDEMDLFPDLSKSLSTISRLFQPHVTGHRKKHKLRSAFYSLGEDPREEEREESSPRQRASDIFADMFT